MKGNERENKWNEMLRWDFEFFGVWAFGAAFPQDIHDQEEAGQEDEAK